MSTGIIEPKDAAHVDEKQDGAQHIDAANSKVLADSDLMNDAFDGENEEHKQGLWDAVKTHPKACFWAFIMCFTIVSLIPGVRAGASYMRLIYPCTRSWSRSICF